MNRKEVLELQEKEYARFKPRQNNHLDLTGDDSPPPTPSTSRLPPAAVQASSSVQTATFNLPSLQGQLQPNSYKQGPGPARVEPKEFQPRNQSAPSSLRIKNPVHTHYSNSSSSAHTTPHHSKAWAGGYQEPQNSRHGGGRGPTIGRSDLPDQYPQSASQQSSFQPRGGGGASVQQLQDHRRSEGTYQAFKPPLGRQNAVSHSQEEAYSTHRSDQGYQNRGNDKVASNARAQPVQSEFHREFKAVYSDSPGEYGGSPIFDSNDHPRTSKYFPNHHLPRPHPNLNQQYQPRPPSAPVRQPFTPVPPSTKVGDFDPKTAPSLWVSPQNNTEQQPSQPPVASSSTVPRQGGGGGGESFHDHFDPQASLQHPRDDDSEADSDLIIQEEAEAEAEAEESRDMSKYHSSSSSFQSSTGGRNAVAIIPGDPSQRFQTTAQREEQRRREQQYRGGQQQQRGARDHASSSNRRSGRGGGGGGGGGGGSASKALNTTGGGGRFEPDFLADEGDEEEDRGSLQRGTQRETKALGFSGFKKAMAEATSTKNTAKGGKSSGASREPRLAGMSRIPKTTSEPKRVIRQDDEVTQVEEATQMVQGHLADRARESGKSYRVGDDRPPTIAIRGTGKGKGKEKGKGKGKEKEKEEHVLELESTDSEAEVQETQNKGRGRSSRVQGTGFARSGSGSDDDPIQNSDNDSDGISISAPGPSSRRSQRKPQASSERPRHGPLESNDPQASDELGMDLPPAYRWNGAAAGTRQGNVAALVQHWEPGASGGGKKVATSLGARSQKQKQASPPSLDGAGTRDGQDNYTKDLSTAPRATAKKSKKKKDPDSPELDPIIDLSIKPYMLAKNFVPPEDARYDLKLTTSGNGSKPPKITITKKTSNQKLTDVVDFKLEDIAKIEWMSLKIEVGQPQAISFTVQTSKFPVIMGKLAEGWLTLQELEGQGPKTELFIISNEAALVDLDRWRSDPQTPLEQVLYCLRKWMPDDRFIGPLSVGRISPFESCYGAAVDAASTLASRERLENRQTATSSKKRKDKKDPSQPQLSFATKSSIPSNNFYSTPAEQARAYRGKQDADGDWVQADGERDVNAQDQQQQLRRSARASTSVFKDGGPRRSLPAPAPDPYPSDHVVLEYPMGQPGSVTVTYGDKKRLNDEEFLNDTLIELGLKKAMVDVKKADESRKPEERIAPATHLFNSFFYKKLSSGKQLKEDKDRHDRYEPHKLVDKWTKRFNLFDKKQIIVPINEHLHWYLAVIVNPKWILDAAAEYPPPSLAQKQEKAHATRGRTSMAAKEQEAEMVLESSSHPATPTADLRTVPEPRKSLSKYTSNDDEEEEEVGEEILEHQHQEQEEVIQIAIEKKLADTTMGGEDVHDADGDVNMIDANLEGGGGNKPSNGKTSELDTLELSDDDEPIVQTKQGPAAPHYEGPAPPPVTASSNGSAGRAAVPIGPPTGPPKGASSPPPAASAPVDSMESIANSYENRSALEIAQELGVDESLADRCWIFTFDSLGGRHDAVVERLKKYINQEAIEKLDVEWTAAWAVQGIPVTVPIQPNFCDCGLYLLHFVEKFLADPELMTKYIVSRNITWPSTKGQSAEAKRKRTEIQDIKNHFNAAYAKEDFFNAAEAQGKRRAMRTEVEGLMEAYKPYKEEKDAKEREEKAAKDRRREERDREKGKGKAKENESEASVDKAQIRAEDLIPKKRKPRGSKKAAEVLDLCSSSDDDEAPGSPKKRSRVNSSRRSSLPPQEPPLASTASEHRYPTSADFLPEASVASAPALTPPRIASTTSQSLAALDAYASDDDDAKINEIDEASGELDNTQEVPSTSQDPTRSLPSPSAAPLQTTRARSVDEAPLSSGNSPPKKRRRVAPNKPPNSAPPPATDDPAAEVVGDQGHDEEEPSSSIELRKPVSPELGLEQPPPNQEQQRRNQPDLGRSREAEEKLRARPDSVSSSSASKKQNKKKKVVGNGTEESGQALTEKETETMVIED